MKVPEQPPATVAHAATQKKLPASAMATIARLKQSRPPISSTRRPNQSDVTPPTTEANPQEIEVIDTRLATSGMLTSRSCAIDSRNGARVVPLEVAAKEPRPAAPTRSQGTGR